MVDSKVGMLGAPPAEESAYSWVVSMVAHWVSMRAAKLAVSKADPKAD